MPQPEDGTQAREAPAIGWTYALDGEAGWWKDIGRRRELASPPRDIERRESNIWELGRKDPTPDG